MVHHLSFNTRRRSSFSKDHFDTGCFPLRLRCVLFPSIFSLFRLFLLLDLYHSLQRTWEILLNLFLA